MEKTIAIDFDGTICREQLFGDGRIYELPTDGAKEAIEELRKFFKIVIFTTRLSPIFGKENSKNQREIIKKWLEKYSIPYDGLTGFKIPAEYIIDDRAIRFTSWKDIASMNFGGK